MEKIDFKNFCTKVIEPYINDLIGNDFCNCLTIRKHNIYKIYLFYEQKRFEIRHFFMHLKTKPMDRHKIGAVMIYAILKSNIFKVNRMVKNIPDELLMANEYLAVYVALSIVESYKRDEINSDNWLINIPETYHEKNNNVESVYINNMCKALYRISNINHFDIFAYANILFLLEKYTDTVNEMLTLKQKGKDLLETKNIDFQNE